MPLSCFGFVPHWQAFYILCDVTAISINITFFVYTFFYNFLVKRIDVLAFSTFFILSIICFYMVFLSQLSWKGTYCEFFSRCSLACCSCNVFRSCFRLYCCSGVLFDIIVLHLLGYCCNVSFHWMGVPNLYFSYPPWIVVLPMSFIY